MAVPRSDVVIVGTGIMGAATARAAARRGVKVVALDRFELGHIRGSSHGASRIFRFSYHEARYVAMAQRAREMWRDLESELSRPLVRQTGGLDFGKDLDLHVEALAACDADHEVLDGAELMRRWPFFALDPGERVLYQPDGGISLADEAWHGFYDSAVRNGADMRQGVQVTSLEPHADGVRVVTTDGELHAGVAVVTAGAWARGLLEPAGIRLDTIPTRETVAFFAMEEAQDIPSIVDWGDPAVYALASPTPAGLKVGMHHAGPSTDPDRAGEPSDETVKSVSAWVRTRFPTADPRPLAVDTCIYTNTPDEDFVLERHGDIVVGSPCSGHGFKFAPLIGEQLAALALGESPESLS